VTARQCNSVRGLFPLLVSSMIGQDSLVDRAIANAKKLKICKSGDHVVVASGQKEGVTGGTNVIRILKVDQDVLESI
jgi:pyruvate kinase